MLYGQWLEKLMFTFLLLLEPQFKEFKENTTCWLPYWLILPPCSTTHNHRAILNLDWFPLFLAHIIHICVWWLDDVSDIIVLNRYRFHISLPIGHSTVCGYGAVIYQPLHIILLNYVPFNTVKSQQQVCHNFLHLENVYCCFLTKQHIKMLQWVM